MVCAQCGKDIPDNAKFCKFCGEACTPPAQEEQGEAAATYCRMCGAALAGRYCVQCGADASEDAPYEQQSGGARSERDTADSEEQPARPPADRENTDDAGKSQAKPPRRQLARKHKIALACIAGVIALSAYYVVTYAWKNQQSTGKSLFSFFAVERGTETAAPRQDEADDIPMDSADADSASVTEPPAYQALANTAQPGGADSYSPQGEWAYKDGDGKHLIRIDGEGAFIYVIDSSSLGGGCDVYVGEISSPSHSADGVFTMRTQEYDTYWDVTAGSDTLTMHDSDGTFIRSSAAPSSLHGLWKDAENNSIYEFLTAGRLVQKSRYGEALSGASAVEWTYAYDPNTGIMHVTSSDLKVSWMWSIEILGEYLVFKPYDAQVVASVWKSCTAEDVPSSAAAAFASQMADQDYIFPDSDTRLLHDQELIGLTAEELRIARNEILARHGWRFETPSLLEHFQSKSWYRGTVDPDDFKYDILNGIEQRNIELIKKFEALFKK